MKKIILRAIDESKESIDIRNTIERIVQEAKSHRMVKKSQFEAEGVNPLESPEAEQFLFQEEHERYQRTPPFHIEELSKAIENAIKTIGETKFNKITANGIEILMEFGEDEKLYTLSIAPHSKE